MTVRNQQTQAGLLKSKGYIPAPAVARAVGRHMSSVYRWISAGHLKATQVGRSWYVEKESLIAYLGDDAKKFFPELFRGRT